MPMASNPAPATRATTANSGEVWSTPRRSLAGTEGATSNAMPVTPSKMAVTINRYARCIGSIPCFAADGNLVGAGIIYLFTFAER